MKSLACIPILFLALLTTVAIVVTYSPTQIDYNDERGEYCYGQSFALGACLGEQQRLHDDLSDAQIIKCMECSGEFQGDETCEELKALNDVALPANETDRFSVSWNEAFCETYNICVEANCPKQCLREQDAWIECLIIELDCDWRCPGSTWLGSRTKGVE